MKFGVVVFPGSNCDHDTVHVLRDIYKVDTVELWHKEPDLKSCDMVLIPGGFSYGDYLRSGAIARFSPVMEKVMEFANKGGFVFGICNGFQVLCEANLLPGALLRNESQKFSCKNVFIKPITQDSVITSEIPENKILKIPIAHAEGRYHIDQKGLDQLKANNQILFQYCDEEGNITAEANPNGSVDNIAGICNVGRNVFGMMPHPERAADDALENTDGKYLFNSIMKAIGVTH